MGARDRRASVAADAPTVLVVGPHVALTGARTTGVRFFERRPPLHGVLLGRCEIALAGRRVRSEGALALPAGVSHSVVGFGYSYAGVAYLDARRYRFEDVQRLAERWRGFVPGRDDLRGGPGRRARDPAAPRRRSPAARARRARHRRPERGRGVGAAGALREPDDAPHDGDARRAAAGVARVVQAAARDPRGGLGAANLTGRRRTGRASPTRPTSRARASSSSGCARRRCCRGLAHVVGRLP